MKNLAVGSAALAAVIAPFGLVFLIGEIVSGDAELFFLRFLFGSMIGVPAVLSLWFIGKLIRTEIGSRSHEKETK